MLALSLLLISRLILLLAHLLKLVVATLSPASPIATIGAPLLILLISAALIVIILVLSPGTTFVTTASLSFHWHAHAHSHAHVAAGAAPSKTWERHASLLQGCLHVLRVQLAANLCEERLDFRWLHILHIGRMGDQLVWIREHLGCHSTDHSLWIAVEIVIISVISPILVATLAAAATASSALIIIVIVATLRLIGSSFSSHVAVVIISIIMMIVVGATVAAPVIAAAGTATSATLRTRASLVTILTSTICVSLLVCAFGLVLTSSTLAMMPSATTVRVVILRRICSSVSACSRLKSSLRGIVAAACSSMNLLEVYGLIHRLVCLLLLLTRVVHNLLPIDGGWLTILSRVSCGRRWGTRRCRWCASLGRRLARLIHRLALVRFLVWF